MKHKTIEKRVILNESYINVIFGKENIILCAYLLNLSVTPCTCFQFQLLMMYDKNVGH